MPAETPKAGKLNKRDLLANFGDRVLVSPERRTERQYLGLAPNLSKTALVPDDIGEKYESTRLSSPEAILEIGLHPDFLAKFETFESGEVPLAFRSVGQEKPATLTVSKFLCRYQQKGENTLKVDTHCAVRLCKGDVDRTRMDKIINEDKSEARMVLGRLNLCRKPDGNFELPHRFIEPTFRGPQNESGENIGDILLAACEQIVRSHANRENQTKTLEVGAGQLSVMVWLHNNGYEPKTDQDKQRWDEIQQGDPRLCIVDEWFVWEQDKWEPNTRVYQERENAYRVNFIKTIQPATAAEIAERSVGDTRTEAKAILQ